MKSTVILVGTAAAGLAGYFCEPALRPILIQPSAPRVPSVTADPVPAKLVTSSGLDPATLTPEQLPKQVVTKSELKFADSTTGVTMSVASGSKVRLIRIESGKAVVRPGDTAYTVSVPIPETDLIEQLEANPPPPPAPVEPPVQENTTSPETVPPTPETPANPPAGTESEPSPTQPPAAVLEAPSPEQPATEVTPPSETPSQPTTPSDSPAPTPFNGGSDPFAPPPAEPATGTATDVPTGPAVTSTETPATGGAAANDVIQLMRQSLANGRIRSFGLAHVTSFEQGPEESVDGQTYQTGLATYRAETSLGVKSVQAKALIRDGAVVRWVGAKSGVELK